MWLLGAGSSASAGIPTAWDMIWEFKQQLYVSQRRVDPKAVADLANPAIQSKLQQYVDSTGNYPAPGAPDEYAALFEAAFPNEGDRRTYLDGKVKGAKPSYGHIALATLMRGQMSQLLWTTNFDTLMADACAKVFDNTSTLSTIDLDASDLAAAAISEQRWPIEVKLHGDFRSRRLKNTNDELRQQDAQFRSNLVGACGRYGLIVAGYSGRDDSIMDALAEALELPNPFPAGLFWLNRGDGTPLPRVQVLLARAAELGVDGGLVSVENFDEALRDIVRILPALDMTALDSFADQRRRWTAPPAATGSSGWPAIRLNAIPLVRSPTVCRLIECSIGGYAEVQAALDAAGVNAIAARSQAGVLAFGDDGDLHSAFDAFDVKSFDLHAINPTRLRFESAERGLIRSALTTALSQAHGLRAVRKMSGDFLTPEMPNDDAWRSLKALVGGNIWGTVPNHRELVWREAIKVRIDWADDRPWLLIDPRILFDNLTDELRGVAADFARERTVRRYNPKLSELIAFWASKLANQGKEFRALTIAVGVDAAFQLSSKIAFSRRLRG